MDEDTDDSEESTKCARFEVTVNGAGAFPVAEANSIYGERDEIYLDGEESEDFQEKKTKNAPCFGVPPRSIQSPAMIRPEIKRSLIIENTNSLSPNHLTPNKLIPMTAKQIIVK